MLAIHKHRSASLELTSCIHKEWVGGLSSFSVIEKSGIRMIGIPSSDDSSHIIN